MSISSPLWSLTFRDSSIIGPVGSPSPLLTPEQQVDEESTPSFPDTKLGRQAGIQEEYHMLHYCPLINLLDPMPLLLMNYTQSIPTHDVDDMQALSFHRTVFGPLKSTRTPAQSAQSLFVDYVVDKKMALHFLLAVAHSELSLYYNNGLVLPQKSYLHFDQGTKLLRYASTPRGPTDHVNMMLSFLYMYMFWMRRDQPVPQKLRELSRTVVDYVRTYKVDELCTNDDVNLFSETFAAGLLIPDQVLLARIFTYLYDRDGFCSFFGCGGSFATFVNDDYSKRRKIWRLSRTAFLLFPEENGLTSDSLPEVHEAAILELYFMLITIHHEINIYSQTGCLHRYGDERRLKQYLDELKKEYSCIFSLVANSEPLSTCHASLMECVTVTFFYALQIYLHRSCKSAFGTDPVPEEVNCALSSLVTAAYSAVALGPIQLLERFQWSLFIGGVETRDPVHREWIITHLSDPALRRVFQLVQEAKRHSPVTMHSVRRIVDGEPR
ncbi:specific transcription factor domain protein [Aspergillus parasiticus SU-1]|uniref:Specific transcription factor domain protein n=1 Tax=Aspergillus parasiticus (strain ATCC 56775 / NRRL 5862 / SRRC 143 / SU-1) TaxID=1403190 RepID=A0A0F0I646_ASPPU|nr:specific transcription factor domain protein [Aspergillus parasiticus SU-1]